MLSTAANGPLWITGAGSGIGRAVAATVAAGSRVALSGRRVSELRATADLVRSAGGEALVVPVDVCDPVAVADAYSRIVDEWGAIRQVVTAAGMNTPRRSWSNQRMPEFAAVLATNLHGTAHIIDVVLPEMRRNEGGTVVVISSYAGWHISSSPGVAYSASKRALGVLTATVNAEAGEDGVRATLICPGDVNTDFLAQRPQAPGESARARMLQPSEVARAVHFALDSPAHVVIDELVLSPLSQQR
jgi:NADP-dependent 3-hydroxy acid dehydrogenase YdfG